VLIDNDFKKYLEQLIDYTAINRDEVFNNCYNIHKSLVVSVEDLLQISNNLKVDPVLLWKKQLDLDVVKSEVLGQRVVPFCYSEMKGSNIVSMNHLLEQLKCRNIYEYAITKIQLNDKMIAESTATSILAVDDLLSFSNSFFNEKDYASIGKKNGRFLYDKVLKEEINRNSSPTNITTKMLEFVFHFERNWNYKIIKGNLNSVLVETCESELMRSTKTYRPYTNPMTNLLRFKFVEGVLKDLGVHVASVMPRTRWDNPKRSFQFTINFH